MDFIITKEQKRMQKAAREFLKAECSSEFVREMEQNERGYTEKFWQKMGELDWMALIVPEQYDGVGGDLMDLVLMLEEMGRACAPGPYFSTVVTGATTLIRYGSEDQKRQLLPKVANAELVLTLALTEPGTTRWDPLAIETAAVSKEGGYVIDGTKLFVPDAHAADYLICAARTAGKPGDETGITLFLVAAGTPGIQTTPLSTIGGDKQFEVVFEGVRIPESAVIGAVGQGADYLTEILHHAAVCKCAEMVGGAEKVLEMAVDYAKERKQFDKPIGTFQAIQHHCANMLIDLEGSRYITYKAAWSLQNGYPSDRQVAIAKAWVSEAFQRIVKLGHQVQGGYAFMQEHDMPLYSRRAAAAAVLFGEASYCRNVVADRLGL